MQIVQFLTYAMAAAALSVTSPTEGQTIPQSGTLDITSFLANSVKWATVSSDSQSFNIQLALSTDSGNAQTLTTDVSPSTNGYSTPASAFSPGNYTVNLIGNSQTSSGVLAQSKWFLITASASSASARASSATSSSTGTTLAAAAASSVASQASASGTATSAARESAAASSGSTATSAAASGASGAPAASSSVPTTSTSAAEKVIASFAGLFVAGFAVFMI